MPDSLNTEELRRLRRIYPDPPYPRHDYQYTYFMGDAATDLAAKSMVEAAVRNRKLVPGSTQAVMRTQPGEKVSRTQPYAMYTDVELAMHAPMADDWPFQSYYYLMDYDHKGPVAMVPGKTPIYSPILRGPGYISTRAPYRPGPSAQIKNEPVSTYITLQGF